MKRIALVSCSGGKDSTATLLLALEKMEHVQAVFADTGNEHPITYEYLNYLESRLRIKIKWVKADFSDRINRHRKYIEEVWPTEGVDPEKVKRASEASVVTGNPYLDMVIWKTRFPSSQSQFCTEELKIKPITEYALSLIDQGWYVESWQGVRAEESAKRAGYSEREMLAENLEAVRPILKWKVKQVFDYHDAKGVEPNPLYKMGMGRVGCMPCINARKKEIAEIALRFPEEIDRIEEWEKHIIKISKREASTFFTSPNCKNEDAYDLGNVRKKVEWATGEVPDLFLDVWENDREVRKISCSSEYGLCE